MAGIPGNSDDDNALVTARRIVESLRIGFRQRYQVLDGFDRDRSIHNQNQR